MSSWFHRLRRKTAATATATAGAIIAEPPAPRPCSPNRASHYVPSRDRDRARAAVPRARDDNPKLRDTRFPPRSPQSPSDIVFDVVVAARRDDRFTNAAPELKLRPIITRPVPRENAAAGGSSAAASPTGRARFHLHAAKGEAGPPPDDHHRRNKAAAAAAEEEACTRSQSRRSRRRRLRRWVYESVVVVKESADPEEDFLESMAEMIAANGAVRSPRGLEELLACYLALNAADHHRAIVAAFRRAWLLQLGHLHRAPPPTPTVELELRNGCMQESCVVVD